MTYKEAYDKIVDAYFKDEIRPMDMDFCFCGTLAQGDTNWVDPYNEIREESECHNYTHGEYSSMETALLKAISVEDRRRMPNTNFPNKPWRPSPTYEDDLFRGMSDALDVLRKIHITRGEDVDNQGVGQFNKRETVMQ